jgi:hypothetical protein
MSRSLRSVGESEKWDKKPRKTIKMSLKCKNASCQSTIARIDQLSARQDALNGKYMRINRIKWLFTTSKCLAYYTGGLNLTFTAEFNFEQRRLPPSINFRENPSNKFLEVFCSKCLSKLGIVNPVTGFQDLSVNFSAKYVNLFTTSYNTIPINRAVKSKWKEIIPRTQSKLQNEFSLLITFQFPI